MKKLMIFGLTIILVSLAACNGTGVSGGVTSSQSTLTALESENASQVTALQAENAGLKAELSNLQNQQQSLIDERDTAVDKADKYYSMFIVENADDEGDFIFCEQAFETSFGYADKVSMRMELIKYLAKLRGYNPEAMSSEHQTIWSNADDIIVRVNGAGYMFPFLVRFGDGGLGHLDAVYDLTNGCYVDFPYLEAQFLSVR
ncbi:MAG: bZIP transcription factor [Anaerolineaceae bacterium]